MGQSGLRVADLMDLAMLDESAAAEHLAKVYEWKYQHFLGYSKALAGAGSAVVLATLLPAFQRDASAVTEWGWLTLAWSAAVVLMFAGAVVYFKARRLHLEYISAQTLLFELRKLAQFVRRYREESIS